MVLSTFQIILLFLVAAVAGMGSVLDSFQTHRPLVACTLVGLVLGDITMGIILGGTLELIALGWMNIGAAQSPDSALASIISAMLVIIGNQPIATGIAIALPVAAAGQVLTVIARTITVMFQHAADKYAESGNFRAIDFCHIGALVIQALRVSIPVLLIALFVSPAGVQNLLALIPAFITTGLKVASGFIVVVGYAMVINMMGAKYLLPFFFLGFVIAGFTTFNLVAFGVLGLFCSIVYVQLNPKFQMNQTAVADISSASNSIDDELDN
ncbi:PTS mannose/fructose/sorbose transporter subunit IIC [Pectinatus haikarae]|uniref:Mannose/fructose/sorbose-specific phosphotransferase system IIC component n=1 Tax=Pectinatus haikarae TaxID=349096 RepID=A0ABT9YAP1_9FIRM|nr:PTS mannose/fructose/sorbose transporter subunit IIC [Pectinatus haikarae]MDQ0204789.1 mannose/fructose/sorbose-specific phosphotransferase system IIC component [Pectinatus haikarae]